ncbi:MAG: hypothetical protein KJN77_03325, partial [Gammaproteobacteria bacterium]|nr:hypothetical protein [Gammaproteobacteria bacterium]
MGPLETGGEPKFFIRQKQPERSENFGSTPVSNRSLTIQSDNLCGCLRWSLDRQNSVRTNLNSINSNLEWGLRSLDKAQSFELKSLILAQIERWRHA